MSEPSGDGRRGTAGGARQVLAAVVGAVPIVVLVLVALALGPRLGGTIATHWSAGSSHPDGFAGTWQSFAVFAGVTAALFVATSVAAVFARKAAWPRIIGAVASMLGGCSAIAWLVSAWATVDASRPEVATLGARLGVLPLGLVCGAGVYLLMPAARVRPTTAAVAPSMALAVGDRVSWTGVIASRGLAVVAGIVGAVFIGALVAAAMTGQAAAWTSAVIIFVVMVTTFLLVPVRLTVDRRGVRLVSVLLRVPLIRVRLDRIESVTADVIDPLQWGGWGYRFSGAGVAYVTRRGPGMIIHRRNGGAVAITVDHPEQPTALANGLIESMAASSRT